MRMAVIPTRATLATAVPTRSSIHVTGSTSMGDALGVKRDARPSSPSQATAAHEAASSGRCRQQGGNSSKSAPAVVHI